MKNTTVLSASLEKRESNERFMRYALREAELAFSEGEVPVGAILVIDDRIISMTHNMKEFSNDPTAHAEILAIKNGATITGNWRMNNATLYVTKEPCIMCAGAMINARLGRLVYGCRDTRYGAVETRFQLLSNNSLNHRIKVTSGVLEEECGEILRRFFKNLRIG